MKIDYSKIKFGGHRIQTPHTQITADPTDVLSKTWHVLPTHIHNQEDPKAFSIKVIDFNWWRVEIDNPRYKTDGQHGEARGANTMKSRKVRIRMEITCNEHAGAMAAHKALMEIYRPAEFPSITSRGFRKLEFEDHDGEKWYFQAQTEGGLPNFTNEIWQNKIIPVTVELVSDGDARIYSEEETQFTIQEGALGGLDIGEGADPLGEQTLAAEWNTKEYQNDEVWYSPCRIQIQFLEGGDETESYNPTIMDVETGDFFAFNYTLQKGSILTIDGITSKTYLNGQEVDNIKNLESVFLSIKSGLNAFVLYDGNHPWTTGKNIVANVFFRKIMI